MSCPSGFQANPTNGTTCVVECPKDKGFETSVVDGMAVCTYKNDNSIYVKLKSVFPPSPGEATTVENMKSYSQAKDEFDKDFAVEYAKIDNKQKIEDAFKDLQAAENVRDQSPQAYQDARIRYYTLLKGDKWINEEKERITNSEVAPKILQYMSSYQDMSTRIAQQRQTLDVVNSVKDKVLSIKDEVAYATDTFSKQISELKNQINIERKSHKEEKKSWIDLILNIVIVVLTIIVIIVLFRRGFRKSAYTQRPGYYQ